MIEHFVGYSFLYSTFMQALSLFFLCRFLSDPIWMPTKNIQDGNSGPRVSSVQLHAKSALLKQLAGTLP